jgi:hypothetical protein
MTLTMTMTMNHNHKHKKHVHQAKPTCPSATRIGPVLALLAITTIGAATTTTTIGTPLKTLRTSCNQRTTQSPHLFIEKNSSKATTTTVASHYVPLQPIGTGINIFINQDEEQRKKLQENYPFLKDGKKGKKGKKKTRKD